MTQLEKSELPVNHYANNKQLVKEVDNTCTTSLCAPSTSTVKGNGEIMGVKSTDDEIVDKNKKSEEKVKDSAAETRIISLNPKRGKFTLSTTQSSLQSVNTTVAIPLPSSSMVIGNAYGGNQSFLGMDDIKYTNRDGSSSSPMFEGNFGSTSRDFGRNKMPGAVGFGNLGNTCFMNSGLQCLVNTPPVVEFFLKSPPINGVSQQKAPLTETFQNLIRGAWQGPQSVIHPREFKDTLGSCYSQFKDTRQHDCQEFLALTLDALHEQLKIWNNVKRGNANETCSSGFASAPGSGSGCSEPLSIANDSDVSSSLQSPSSNAEAAEPLGQEPSGSKKRRLTEDSEVTAGNSADNTLKSQGSSPAKEETVSEGENELLHPNENEIMHLDENDENEEDVESGEDVLLEEGQDLGRRALKAKAKQAEGFWLNYIRDNNTVIASSFQGMYKSTVTCSVCNFVSCTYEPFMYLSLPIPRTTEREFDVIYCGCNDFRMNSIKVTMNINDSVGRLKEKVITQVFQEIQLEVPPSSNFVVAEVVNFHIHNILKDDHPLKNVKDGIYNVYVLELNQTFSDPSANNIAGNAISEPDYISPCYGFRPQTYIEEDWDNETTTQTLITPSNSGVGFIPSSDGDCFITSDLPSDESTCKEEAQGELISCSVCLEELQKSKLKQHYGCSCILCSECISKTAECLKSSETITSDATKTGSRLKCPVCSDIVDYNQSFHPLITGDGPRKLNLIPVIFHYDSNSNNNASRFIGHPLVVQLPSTLPAAEFHDFVSKLVPFPSNTFVVKNASWNGKECGVCMFNRSCSGCEFRTDGIISINSRNSLLISFTDLSSDLISSIEPSNMATCSNPYSSSYSSNSNCYKEEPIIDIYECLDAFSKTEYLDDQNPWFCPSCKKMQCATKSLTICRFPDYLIVYLKRFVFVDNSSNKLNNKLKFPISDFDVSKYIAEEFAGGEHVYDLYSCVCHFGTAIGGHYTSYSKNPKFDAWHYFNDDSVSKKCPSNEEFESAYVLFYAKKGLKSDIPLKRIQQSQLFPITTDAIMKDSTGECDTTTVLPDLDLGLKLGPELYQSCSQEAEISSSTDQPDSNEPSSVSSSASYDKVNCVRENVSNLCIDINRRKRVATSTSTSSCSGTAATSSTNSTSFEFENEFEESPTIKPYAEFAIENKRLTKIAQRSKFSPSTQAPSTSGFRKHF